MLQAKARSLYVDELLPKSGVIFGKFKIQIFHNLSLVWGKFSKLIYFCEFALDHCVFKWYPDQEFVEMLPVKGKSSSSYNGQAFA